MNKTVLFDRHIELGARMVEFSGWRMPLQYPTGIVEEHLLTRKEAGLFDISHMGRFLFRGKGALDFLQHGLTNNAAALAAGKAHYTMIPDPKGAAVDDAYLYHPLEEEYLLVVNAANREKDWRHFQTLLPSFPGVELVDQTEELAMLALQGPLSRQILKEVLDGINLPEPERNSLSIGAFQGERLIVSRTGYTGEALSFELFVPRETAGLIWDRLIEKGASPVGLGARDTLRLEAGLPLYGHELGIDPEGIPIPIFACPLARYAVSFSPLKRDFIGRPALYRQFRTFQKILKNDFSSLEALPRLIRQVTLLEKGIVREGSKVYSGESHVGWVTSGTVVPYWVAAGEGLYSVLTEQKERRAICMALLDSHIGVQARLNVDMRGKQVEALVVPFLLRSEAPPVSRVILYAAPAAVKEPAEIRKDLSDIPEKVQLLLERSLENTRWRQMQCINLIPSEMTQSPLARLLSVMDPAFRYAEHKKVKALNDADVFYYQGTGFIDQVERLLAEELVSYLGSREVETRIISGQMANTTVFSALVDYLNRDDRKSEPRRIRSVMNHHIIKGGHLSAQPMGALRDFVARDPQTEKPAVVNFPVLPDNPYKTDISRVQELLERHRPELIILGKSMTIHSEPVREIRRMVDELSLETMIMYDMAHVLGLIGPYFQEPFKEGVDLVTGSTHKTFFGTQRGIVSSNYVETDPKYKLWEAVERRSFPGSVSNHHLGTLLGLLLSAYEMNYFKDEYQKRVLANARALAGALKEAGMDVAGDPEVSYTETHQVIVNVGYSKGVAAARQLEENNIIVNFQATPLEEGFTASGALRLGVSEMTRFGLREEEFRTIAWLIGDVVLRGRKVKEEVVA
ncbi:MAG: glycine cleavage system aminomethyltransferase GcvT, partial [Spirochaetota bacterium]